jgi:hypothetical protein
VDGLERHAIRWRFNGMPRYSQPDDNGDCEIVGYVQEPIWRLHGLTPDQQADVGIAILEACAARPDGDHRRTYASVLDHYGVACPHPPEWRTYRISRTHAQYTCGACDVAIVATTPEMVARMRSDNVFIEAYKEAALP